MAFQQIHRGGPDKVRNDGVVASGSADVSPGMLLDCSGGPEAFTPSAAAGTRTQVLLADVEPYLSNAGDGTNPVADGTYSAGDGCPAFVATPGTRVVVRLDDAAAESVTGGETYLTGAGNGNVRTLDGAGGETKSDAIMKAREDASTSAGGGITLFEAVVI